MRDVLWADTPVVIKLRVFRHRRMSALALLHVKVAFSIEKCALFNLTLRDRKMLELFRNPVLRSQLMRHSLVLCTRVLSISFCR